MATRQKTKLTVAERQRRHFSESFKLQKVREIELGITKISEICKEYEVSDSAVRRWLDKFGLMKNKKERLIVETESDTRQLLELKKKIADLERSLGQKQVLLEFKDKMIEVAEEMYGVDIKKKLSTQLSKESGMNENDTTPV
ncbi:transposase [Lentimicrobium sp. S6]|uniref:transposase n=1 Tax=Lentimicrobium sp. S6 TaxID=2735872 RepID=UPI001552872C|nr:transposase [Lentimicrobium sp. S6]NPD46752.1 transposase [Lentimicrobium sp. S6]